MKFNWFVLLPLVVTAGFVAIAGIQLTQNRAAQSAGIDTQALPSAQQGRAAPALDLQDLPGSRLLVRDDLQGNGLVIVNFWASWCPPCRAEHPTLSALAAAGNPLYGVNYRDQIHQALAFLDELGNPYDAIGTDPQARNGRDWGIVAMPETFFIDTNGMVVLHFRGPVTQRALQTRIIPALQDQGHTLLGQ
jgi:cytochrome c biogenesis protein CcmG/thiol:disulfide interchange protein DsbE